MSKDELGGQLIPGWREDLQRRLEQESITREHIPSVLPRVDEQLSGMDSSCTSGIRKFCEEGPLPEAVERLVEASDHYLRFCEECTLKIRMSQEGDIDSPYIP